MRGIVGVGVGLLSLGCDECKVYVLEYLQYYAWGFFWSVFCIVISF